MKPLCIYHANCADGFGAAWVVRRALGEAVEFHPGIYYEAPPDVTGRNVIMVDFSYKRPVLVEMSKRAKTVFILDHHKSAQEDLVDLPANVTAVFDMDHSGAMLAWMHYFPIQPPPQLIRHIEDRDLWRFEIPGTRAVQAAVFSYPYDFEVWDVLMDVPTQALVQEGMTIERKHFKDLDELIPQVTRRMKIAGHDVPAANLPYTFSSDAGHILGKGEPFAACYWDTPGGRAFSLRSEPGGTDVSAIAKMYGGGGHEHAAGFTVDYDTARSFEVAAHD